MGLREAKKERLRADLATAAIELFTARGYEITTVEDIAAVAGVSPRTFFRYFPTKDDVVMETLRAGAVDLQDHLARRPTHESLPVALRAAVHAWAHDAARSPATMQLVASLLRSNPRLRARAEDERRCDVPALVELVARRLGVDANCDPRPRIIVTLVFSAVSCGVERWSEDGSTGDLDAYIDDGMKLLECGLPNCQSAATPAESPVAHHTDSARITSRLSVVTPSTP